MDEKDQRKKGNPVRIFEDLEWSIKHHIIEKYGEEYVDEIYGKMVNDCLEKTVRAMGIYSKKKPLSMEEKPKKRA